MPRLRLLFAAGLLAAVAAGAAAVARRSADRAVTGPRVRLAVLVVFDQMRGDYVEKWRPLFGQGGFRRMEDEGAWFTDCHYPYATTQTGPGHASILSGTSAERHGIITNEWYDQSIADEVYCAGSDRYDLIPPAPPAATAPKKKPAAGAPVRMLSPTLGDALKEATGGKGRVFGLSLKDRSAVLPTGRRPDGAYWFNGRFVTSTYYREVVHPWVAKFNADRGGDRWFGRPWTRLRPDLDYVAYSGPDDVAGEGKPNGQGVTFPHPTDGGKKQIGKEYYDALANSPFGNDLLLEFTAACVAAERLGQDDVPDLLTVSFSSNDLIGHTWGPDSQEVLDVTLRSDRVVADLLRVLDHRVGRGNYAVAITADHGICPLPEVSRAKGLDAARVSPAKLFSGAETHLRSTFGLPLGATDPAAAGKVGRNPGLWIESTAGPWVYLNSVQISRNGLSYSAVADSLAGWLRGQPGVLRVYTAADLRGELPADDEIGRRVKRSYHPARSGDVYVVLKPYHLLSDPLKGTGTNHGTPHEYDTHVPLLVYGPGVPGGRRAEPVTPQHTAAILARFLGIGPPGDAVYPVPATLFGPAGR